MSLPHRYLLLQPEHPLEASASAPPHTACLAPVCKFVSPQTQHGMQGGVWGVDLTLKKLLAVVGSVIHEVAAKAIGSGGTEPHSLENGFGAPQTKV